MIFLKTEDEIALMRKANLLVGSTLAEIGTLPCSFEYTYGDKYEMDWTDPSTTTTAEAD